MTLCSAKIKKANLIPPIHHNCVQKMYSQSGLSILCPNKNNIRRNYCNALDVFAFLMHTGLFLPEKRFLFKRTVPTKKTFDSIANK